MAKRWSAAEKEMQGYKRKIANGNMKVTLKTAPWENKMNLIKLQEEGDFQKKLEANQCPKCNIPLKTLNESQRKCDACKLVIEDNP